MEKKAKETSTSPKKSSSDNMDRKLREETLREVRLQAIMDGGVEEDQVERVLSLIAKHATRHLPRISSDANLLVLCVHSLAEESDSSSITERVDQVLASFGDVDGRDTNWDGMLCFRLPVIVDLFRLTKVGKCDFSEDATFADIRDALLEFWNREISASLGNASPALSKSSSNDEGTVIILMVDDEGWSKELNYGNFSMIATAIAQKRAADMNDELRTIMMLRSNRDPIGPRHRLAELQYNVRHNKLMRQRTAQLAELDYIGYRAIRGDGNCYYRAVMTGYLEHGIGGEGDDREKRMTFIDRFIKRIQPLVDSIRQFYGEELAAIHCKLVEWLPKCASWEHLESLVLMNPSLDLALVRVARCLAATFLVANEGRDFGGSGITIKDSILPLYPAHCSVLEYCKEGVYRMGQDAEGPLVDMGVLLMALECKCVTVLMDAKSRDAKEHSGCPGKDLVVCESGDGLVGTLHLMLRAGLGNGEGHYDLLYKNVKYGNSSREKSLRARVLQSGPAGELNHVRTVTAKTTNAIGTQTVPQSNGQTAYKRGSNDKYLSPSSSSTYSPSASKKDDGSWQETGKGNKRGFKASSANQSHAHSEGSGRNQKSKGSSTTDTTDVVVEMVSEDVTQLRQDEVQVEAVSEEPTELETFDFIEAPRELTLRQKIFEAAKTGATATLLQLLEEAQLDPKPQSIVDHQSRDDRRMSPLHAACEAGAIECVKLLLPFFLPFCSSQNDKKPIEGRLLMDSRRGGGGKGGRTGMTPLMVACLGSHLPIVKLLMEQEGASKMAEFVGGDFDSALVCALSAASSFAKRPSHPKASQAKQIISLLLDHGLEISPFQNAELSKVEEGLLLEVQRTRSANASSNEERSESATPLKSIREQIFDAVLVNDVDALRPLIGSRDGAEILQRWGNLVVGSKGAGKGTGNLESPLCVACRKGYVATLEVLLSLRCIGSNFYRVEIKSAAPLLECLKGAATASEGDLPRYLKCIEQLLAHDSKIPDSKEVLLAACSLGRQEFVRLLIIKCSDVAEVAKDGELKLKFKSQEAKACLREALAEMRAERTAKQYPCSNDGCRQVGSAVCPTCLDKYKIPDAYIEHFCGKDCFKQGFKSHKQRVHVIQEKIFREAELLKQKKVAALLSGTRVVEDDADLRPPVRDLLRERPIKGREETLDEREARIDRLEVEMLIIRLVRHVEKKAAIAAPPSPIIRGRNKVTLYPKRKNSRDRSLSQGSQEQEIAR